MRGSCTAAAMLARVWLDDLRHDPAMLADLAVADEAELLVRRERAVEEEAGGYRRAVLGIALDRSPAEAGDELERAGERCARHARASMALADEVAGDAPVGRGRLRLLVGRAALDAGELVGRAELDPAQAVVAVEHERGVGGAGADALELAHPVDLRRGVADAVGVEAHAPAA